MSEWHLAQLNIAHLQAPLESDQLADFVANLDRINELAEQSPGFVWRYIEDEADSMAVNVFDSDQIVNLSVWESIELLHDYVYRSTHKEIMRRKKEWFHSMPRAHMVLWWMPSSQLPSVQLAKEKLDHLQDNGPTKHAFTFRQAYSRPDQIQP